MAPIQRPQLGGIQITDGDFATLIDAHASAVSGLLPRAETAIEGSSTADAASPTNIVGVGIGVKTLDATRQVPAVVVAVREKVGRLAIPEASVLPREIGRILTDVVETGEFGPYSFLDRYRPCPGGASIGTCRSTHPGTIGCFVRDALRTYGLSNNHVLAKLNQLPPGSPVSQPGRRDGGTCPTDIVGKLAKYIPLYANFDNQVDCALVDVKPQDVDHRVLRGNASSESLTDPETEPVLHSSVQKSGRTTGHTIGRVELLNFAVNMNFGSASAPVILRLVNQFAVTGVGFSRPGDSGSLVTTHPANQPVGLLVGGAGHYTVCNSISLVLQALDVTIAYQPMVA